MILRALLLLVCTSSALAHDPLELVPADTLIAWRGRPFTEDGAAPSSRPSALATLIDVGTRIAGSPLRAREQIGVRLLEAFGVAINYPFALAMIDAQALPTDSGVGRRVDKLKLALIIRTEGKSDPFRKIIHKTVNEMTDRGKATLERRTAAGFDFEELRDQRLPEAIAWGQIGDCFVIAHGPDVWPQIAEVAAGTARSLAGEDWIAEARAALKTPPLIEVIVAAAATRERLDPFVHGRATSFFRAWHADKVERGYWALGFEGPALYCIANFRTEQRTIKRVYADPSFREPRFMSTIPEGARYAIYRLPVSTMLPRLFSGYYATQDDKERNAASEEWQKIQAKYEFDAQRDLLDNLGDTIVLHNDPPHPMRLPLAFTSLIEVRQNPQRVRDLIEKICTAWGDWLETGDEEEGPRWARLERDDDGIWSFQYGPVAGLAWTVTDKFIVTSWTPAALRDYLKKAGGAAGSRP